MATPSGVPMFHLLSVLLFMPAHADCARRPLERALRPVSSASFEERPRRTVEALIEACTLSEDLEGSLRIWAHMEDGDSAYLTGMGCDPDGWRRLSRVVRQLEDEPMSLDRICAEPLQAVESAGLDLDPVLPIDQRLLYGQVLRELDGLPPALVSQATEALRGQGLGIGSLVPRPWDDMSAPLFSSLWVPLMDEPFESTVVERRCLVYAAAPTPTDCDTPVLHLGRKGKAGAVFTWLEGRTGDVRFLLPVRNGTSPQTLPRVVDFARSSDSVAIDVRVEPRPRIGHMRYNTDDDVHASIHLVDGSASQIVLLRDLRRALRDLPDGTVRVSAMADLDARALLSALVASSLDGRTVVLGDGASCNPYDLRRFMAPETPSEALLMMERSCSMSTGANRLEAMWREGRVESIARYRSSFRFHSAQCSEQLETAIAAPFDLAAQAAAFDVCGVHAELSTLGIEVAPWWSADHARLVAAIGARVRGLDPDLREAVLAPYLRPHDNYAGLREVLADTHVRQEPLAIEVPPARTKRAHCVVRPDRGESASCGPDTTIVVDHLTGATLDAWLATSPMDGIGVLVAGSPVLTVTAPRRVELSLLAADQRREREHAVQLHIRDGVPHARGIDPVTSRTTFDVPLETLATTLGDRRGVIIRLHGGEDIGGDMILTALAACTRANVRVGWGPMKPDASVVPEPERLGAPNGILGALAGADMGHPHGVRIVDANVLGELDEDIVVDVVAQRLPALRQCHLRHGRGVGGRTSQKLTIGPDGRVVAVSTESSNFREDLGTCVQAVLQELRFPEPGDGGTVIALLGLKM